MCLEYAFEPSLCFPQELRQEPENRILGRAPGPGPDEGRTISHLEGQDGLSRGVRIHGAPVLLARQFRKVRLDDHGEEVQAPGPGQLPLEALPARAGQAAHQVGQGLPLYGDLILKADQAVIPGRQSAGHNLAVLALETEGGLLPGVDDYLHGYTPTGRTGPSLPFYRVE